MEIKVSGLTAVLDDKLLENKIKDISILLSDKLSSQLKYHLEEFVNREVIRQVSYVRRDLERYYYNNIPSWNTSMFGLGYGISNAQTASGAAFGKSVNPTPAPTAHKPDFGKYAGKLVFVEKQGKNEKGEPVVNHDNGEYFVVRSTEGNLYTVKLVSGYGGHQTKILPIIGTNPFKVLDSYSASPDTLKVYFSDMEKFIAKKGMPDKQWVDSVYDEAANNVASVKRTLGL
jgi:hypothetical protein